VLVEHSLHASKAFSCDKFAIAGGVASNSSLREAFRKECEKNHIRFYHPSPVYCTDNAAMIGAAGYYEYIRGVRHGWDLNAVPGLKL
ncbi:MAG: tRNA (adenosine(37)-N6)-threonylcarbamoyltransferase complex transferase subunit TsaD, partial [Acetatifactor sp.]|nr:tRNA (adenosine(37)-N6)-threonylcarbamoyltransferase complex transferase subunit TsaD [Acetatifactor sp.]